MSDKTQAIIIKNDLAWFAKDQISDELTKA